jgi:hypothetical protein
MLNPPTYKSSATVLVQDNTPIAPLMEGRTAAPNDAARATISRDVLFGHRVMDEVCVREVGITRASARRKRKSWSHHHREHRVVVTERTQVRSTDPKLSLVKITYADSDPKRAYAVAKRFSEALIEQVLRVQAHGQPIRLSVHRCAGRKYQVALGEADKKLQDYRSVNPDAVPGVDGDVAARIGELRRAADNASMDLADVGAQEHQLMGMLSRESQITTISRSTQPMHNWAHCRRKKAD